MTIRSSSAATHSAIYFSPTRSSRGATRASSETATVSGSWIWESRNGSWVNEERVEERLLTSSDAVRLGSLSVTLESEPEPAERDAQDPTVYLQAEPSSDAGPTVMLLSKDLPDAEPPGETGTVVLPPTDTIVPEQDAATRMVEVGHEDPTLRKPDPVPREALEAAPQAPQARASPTSKLRANDDACRRRASSHNRYRDRHFSRQDRSCHRRCHSTRSRRRCYRSADSGCRHATSVD